MRLNQKNNSFRLFSIVLLFVLPCVALAAAPGSATETLNTFKTSSLSFYTNIMPYCIDALWKLALLSFLWLTLQNVIKGGHDWGESGVLLIKLSIFPALYTIFIKKGIEWLPSFIESAKYLGTKGTGQTIDLNPEAIFRIGMNLENVMIVSFNDASNSGLASVITNFFPSLLLFAVCILVLLAFGMMAAMVYIITAEAFILISLAPVLFAMGGSHWTKGMAMMPWNSMIGVMFKLIILYVILSIAISAAPSWALLAATWSLTDWSPLFTVAWQALVFAYLTLKIPQLAQNALSGSASLSAGDALQMAGAAAVGGVGAMAAGATGVGSAYDAAKNRLFGDSKGSDNNLTKATSLPISRGVPDLGGGKNTSANNSMYEPLDHSKGPLNLAAKYAEDSKNTGNASKASIGGSNAKDTSASNKPSKLDHLRGGLDTFTRAVPNDHVAAGGSVKGDD